jgi:branched-chain amino acid transport system permease protein
MWPRPTAALTGLAAAATLPWLVDAYTISLASNAAILAVVALSVHLLATTGLVSFGQTAYVLCGAYTAALLADAGVSSAAGQLLAAVAAGAIAAGVTGPVLLRTRGPVFLMATFALGQLAVIVATKTPGLGGDEGLTIDPITLPGGPALSRDGHLYLYVLAVTALLTGIVVGVLRSHTGLVWRAIAAHEPRTAALGYRVDRHRLGAHLAAGAVAGAGGALLMATHHTIAPTDAGFDLAACALLAVTIGAGSLPGTLIGAALIVTVRDLIGASTHGHGLALLGVLFVAVAHLRAPLRRLPPRIRDLFRRTR